MSPKLTEVVASDPSLLANQDYVAHNNPALAQFLQMHPDIARNPASAANWSWVLLFSCVASLVLFGAVALYVASIRE